MRNLLNESKKKIKLKWHSSMVLPVVFLILLLLVTGLLLNSYALNEVDKTITFTSNSLSYENSVPGSFKVNKKIEWTGKQSAKITFDVDSILKTTGNYRDVILAVDISSSLSSEELEEVKSELSGLVNSILLDSNNRVALLTVETESEVLLEFTNDKASLISQINGLTGMQDTNYYQTLVNVDNILKDYTKSSDRDCLMILITDGYVEEDISNNGAQYSYLKNEYSYLTISGVQYGVGSEVLDSVKEVSDTSYSSSIDNLNNTLLKASNMSVNYDSFVLTDYVNGSYFEVDSVDLIKASTGTYSLNYEEGNPKVIWTIPSYGSGFEERLEIEVKLKNSLVSQGGNYSSNIKTSISYKIGDISEVVETSESPVLPDDFQVIYDGNAPSDCTISVIPESENKSVYETVEISDVTPTCGSYQFQGWKIVTEGVEEANDDYFIMPESDVILRAEWGQTGLVKSMSGSVMPATPGTATEEDILLEKTAWVDGIQLTGSMPNNGSQSRTLSFGSTYTIPKGYHDGTGVISTESLSSATSGTAVAEQILDGETAWVNGVKVTGTMTNQGSKSSSLNAGGSYTIPKGYHDGTGKVTANSLASQTAGTATATDILEGKTAWVNGSKITGTGKGYDEGVNRAVQSFFSGETYTQNVTFSGDYNANSYASGSSNASASDTGNGETQVLYISKDQNNNSAILAKITISIKLSAYSDGSGKASYTLEMYDADNNLLETKTDSVSSSSGNASGKTSEVILTTFDYPIQEGVVLKITTKTTDRNASTSNPGVSYSSVTVNNITLTYITI